MVELKLPKTLRIHPIVNVSHVKPYLGPLPSQPVSWPGPIQVSEECDEEYEVDYIVASHIYRRQLQYLVHWKDLGTCLQCKECSPSGRALLQGEPQRPLETLYGLVGL